MRVVFALASLLPLALAQDTTSAPANDTASAAPTQTSAAGNGTAPGNATTPGNATEYAATVVQALQGANLNGLADIAQNISGTPDGRALFAQLQTGNKTVFAPNDEALQTVSQEVRSDPALLTTIFAYHVLNNTYTTDGIATAPQHTIARTLLRDGAEGNWTLPGNRSQPLVLAKSGNGTGFDLIGSTSNITVSGNATRAANLEIYTVDRVVPIPPRIEEIAPQLAPALTGFLTELDLLEPLQDAPGITVFAPNDAALQAANAALTGIPQENFTAILSNHIINGSVVYSDTLGSSNATSAGGAPFTFATNDTGSYVTSGNATARIIQSDIIIANGVIHVIDSVLTNSESNPDAAAAAASSAAQSAATAPQTDPTGPVTATDASPSSPGATDGGGASAASPLAFSGVSVALTVAGLAIGLIVAQ